MFNTVSIRKKAITAIQSMNDREIIAANEYLSKVVAKKKKKCNILDFAGVWKDIPDSDMKILEKILSGRRKSTRRSRV
jgi:hypothetical protein